MSKACRAIGLGVLIIAAASCVPSQEVAGTMAFTVSMEQPSKHYYHVEFRCDGLQGDTQDFKMPVWMPGYYRIMDYPRHVTNFKAVDGAGRPLPWAKTTKNTWQVKTANAPQVVVSYDVYAFTVFVANNYLDDQRGYIVGPGLYVHPAGMINHPVTVTFKPHNGWTTVANGLDAVPGQPYTFSAPDFDMLYDCPTLLGNQERFQFEVKSVPHYVVVDNIPAEADRNAIAAGLKKMVTTATDLMGDIPYKHYTFLLIGKGVGGVEHLTSAAMLFDASNLATPEGLQRLVSFAAHEYFHTFNVKRIRPIALGPFDYDREVFTNALYVSEGFTSYYSGLILQRAGFTSPDEYLSNLSRGIARLENGSGHLFQSVAESSIDTWIKAWYLARDENLSNTSISYYSKGSIIGALLDLKIRNETKNQKSLDDVMRTLYKEYYQEKKRGFTDAEFREVCERVAGAPLAQIFDDYVYDTKEIDYPKYFAYAGLKIDTEPRPQPGVAYLGAVMDNNDTQVISWNRYDSPAQQSGLSARDRVVAIDGTPMGESKMDDILKTKKPDDKIKFLIARGNGDKEVEVVLAQKLEKSCRIERIDNPTSLQSAILNSWLKSQ